MTKYELLTDSQLWELLQSGDRRAYAAIYERYFGILYVHARNRLKNTQEAEDIIQQLFVDLWSSSGEVTIKSSLINYLIVSTRNRVLNFLSRNNFQENYKASLATQDTFESQTDHLVRERLLSKIIKREIESLPPKMRRVFLMSRHEHLTYMEISKRLDITEQSVRSHVKNALKVLRVRLGIILYILFLFYW